MNEQVILEVFPDGGRIVLFLSESSEYKLPTERSISRIRLCNGLLVNELEKQGKKSCEIAISFYVFGFYITLRKDVRGYNWKLTGYEHIRKSGSSLSSLLSYVVSQVKQRGSTL